MYKPLLKDSWNTFKLAALLEDKGEKKISAWSNKRQKRNKEGAPSPARLSQDKEEKKEVSEQGFIKTYLYLVFSEPTKLQIQRDQRRFRKNLRRSEAT